MAERQDRTFLPAFAVSTALISGLVAMPVAQADSKASLEIRAAERAYQQARQTYQETLANARQRGAARERSRIDYLNDWAELWEQMRLADKAKADLRQRHDEDVRQMRSAITDLRSAADFANAEVEDRNARLLNILYALRDAQSGTDKALIQGLTAEADVKRDALRQAETRLREIQEELVRADGELRRKQTGFQTALAAIAEDAPTLEDVQALEKAYHEMLDDIGHLPLEETVAVQAGRQENTASALLAALLRHQPVYVKRVSVSLDGQPWYEAEMTEDRDGQPDPATARLIQATDDALAFVRQDLEELDRLIDVADREMEQTAADWKDASDRAGNAQLAMIRLDRDMAVFTLVAESAAVIVTSAATGGLAGPATLGFLEAVLKAGSKGSAQQADQAFNVLFKWSVQKMDARGVKVLLSETGSTYRGKKWAEYLLSDASGPDGSSTLSAHESVVLGDLLEMVMADGAADMAELSARALAGAELGSAGAKVGIAALTTGSKYLAQVLTDTLKDTEQHRAFRNTLDAALQQQSYMRLAAAKRRLIAERDGVRAQLSALQDLREHGLMPRKLVMTADNAVSHDEAAKIGRWEVRVTFSGLLDYAPEISSYRPGVTFESAGRSDTDPAQWLFDVNGFDVPADRAEIKLAIDINQGEPPYSFLDAKPQTPTFPGSLTWHEVANFEAGTDVNHRLLLKPESVTVGVYSLQDPAIAECGFRDIDVGSSSQGPDQDLPTIYDDTPTFDVARGVALEPFKASDPVSLCIDPSSHEPKTDRSGRLIIVATHPPSTHQYSNGYVPPHYEELNRLFNEGLAGAAAASQANEEAMFGASSPINTLRDEVFVPPAVE